MNNFCRISKQGAPWRRKGERGCRQLVADIAYHTQQFCRQTLNIYIYLKLFIFMQTWSEEKKRVFSNLIFFHGVWTERVRERERERERKRKR
jgi:hypothetical protein